MNQLDALADQCGYTQYLETYLTYPPSGVQPTPNDTVSDECDVWFVILEEALRLNPAFNIYKIFDTVCGIYTTSSPYD